MSCQFRQNFVIKNNTEISLLSMQNTLLISVLIFTYFQYTIIEILVGLVAQSVEQRTENPCVAGSIPARATIK